MRKTHIAVLAVAVVVIVMAIGAVAAYGDLASDTQAPTTTTDAVQVYWDDAAITLTAEDDEGIRYIYHELDNKVVRLHRVEGAPFSAHLEVPTNARGVRVSPGVGTHTLLYWAQDINGNVEERHQLTFEVREDTPPTTSAKAVSVRRGRTATLKFKVDDAGPEDVAQVVIKVQNKKGKVVRTIKAGSRRVGVDQTAQFRCTLAKGVYTYYVYATDSAGQAQSKVGSAKLTVK
ncbi:MAG: hypothetical protein QM323_04270 [Acidobacteriota bacterium]|nr:hypothetical protein [Acidobacteriota bacterium]